MRLRKITSSILAVSVLFSSISPGISLVHAANPSSATANVVGGYRFLTTTVDFGGVDTLATGDVVTLDFTTSSGGTITFTGSNDGGTNISFPGKDIGSIIVFPDNTSVEIPVTISGSISDSVGTVYFSGITKTF